MSSGQRRDQIRPLGYKEGFHRVRQTSMSKLLKSAVQNGFLHTFTRLPFPPNFKLAPFFLPLKSCHEISSPSNISNDLAPQLRRLDWPDRWKRQEAGRLVTKAFGDLVEQARRRFFKLITSTSRGKNNQRPKRHIALSLGKVGARTLEIGDRRTIRKVVKRKPENPGGAWAWWYFAWQSKPGRAATLWSLTPHGRRAVQRWRDGRQE